MYDKTYMFGRHISHRLTVFANQLVSPGNYFLLSISYTKL